jgi:orotate phosphoribosyltransferase
MIKSEKIIEIFGRTPNFFVIGPKITTSDRVAPIYPEVRRIYSSPENLKAICREIEKFLKFKKIKYDFIFGGATAGIQIATALALLVNKPCGYVRTRPKAGGMGLAVEGDWRPGMRVILLDDSMGHGAAKTKFIKNIRQAGLIIDWVIVPVSRTNTGRGGRECMKWIKPAKVNFQSFCDVYDILNYSLKHNIITESAAALLRWYADDAANWHKDKNKWQFFQNYLKQKHASKSGV